MFMENHHSKISEKSYIKRGEIPSKDRDGTDFGSSIIFPAMPV
jgi:hypothetical protein